jgi:hypothetical protein
MQRSISSQDIYFFIFLGGQTKDEAIKTYLRVCSLRLRLEQNYETAKQALVQLHNSYEKSKEMRNPFNRYPLLKSMIKVSQKYCRHLFSSFNELIIIKGNIESFFKSLYASPFPFY